MQTSTAYFAGVGTVIVAISAGLGGGYLAANMANTPPAVSKLERRMSAEPISVVAAPAQSVPRAVAPDTNSAQEQPQPSAQQQQQAQVEAAAPSDKPATSASNVVAEDKPASNTVAQPVQPAPPPARSTEQKQAEQVVEKSASRDAYAKARDTDLKRADAEKRRAERRQALAERRHVQPPREPDLEAVEERVREVTEPRRIRIREDSESRDMFAEPAKTDSPRIRLFGEDD